MSTTLAMIRLANRDPSTQVGNSVQLSAGYSFPDLKQSSGGRNSPRIKLMACGGLLQTTALPYEASYQSNAVRNGKSVIIREIGSQCRPGVTPQFIKLGVRHESECICRRITREG